MDKVKLEKLCMWRVKIEDEIAELEASIADQVTERQVKLNKINEALAPVINQSDAEGTKRNHRLKSGPILYSQEKLKYRVKDREEFNKFVLEDPEKRIHLFKGELEEDKVNDYRKDTGASDVEGKIHGGKLPTGSGLHIVKQIITRRG